MFCFLFFSLVFPFQDSIFVFSFINPIRDNILVLFRLLYLSCPFPFIIFVFLGEHQLGYGICTCWDLQFLVSPVSSSSMLPCPRLPKHLIQVPDLIDLALPVFFGGRWHILQTSAQVSIQENNFHSFVLSKFDMRCEATSLARTRSSGLTCKVSIFGLLFMRPENVFRALDFAFFSFSAAPEEEFGHIFRAPENIFLAGIRAPEKGLAESILGNPRQKKIRCT